MSITEQSSLIGPDASDEPTVEIDCTGPDTWAKQFVNRWVFLKHQRPHALKELMQCLTEIRNGSDKQTANGTTVSVGDCVAVSVAELSPIQNTDADRAEINSEQMKLLRSIGVIE